MSIINNDCVICHENVKIPIIPLSLSCVKNGICNYIVCLKCWTIYLGFNIKRSNRISKKCLYCPEIINNKIFNIKSSYIINYSLMNIIDNNLNLFGYENGIICNDCNTSFTSHKHLLIHLKSTKENNIDPCPFAFVKCKYFNYRKCSIFIQNKDLEYHENSCKFRPICRICKIQYNNIHKCNYEYCIICKICFLKTDLKLHYLIHITNLNDKILRINNKLLLLNFNNK
jgi:hypothetical protein